MSDLAYIHSTGLLAKIADDGQVSIEELTPGDLVKIGGDWLTLTAITDDAVLRMTDDNESPCFYPATVGERFVKWNRGF